MKIDIRLLLLPAVILLLALNPSMGLSGGAAQSTTTALSSQTNEDLIDLEGFVLSEPQLNRKTNEWQFKFAPKKNKQLKDVYMMVTVPVGSGKYRKTYLYGSYVTIKTRPQTIQMAISEKKARDIANSSEGL